MVWFFGRKDTPLESVEGKDGARAPPYPHRTTASGMGHACQACMP